MAGGYREKMVIEGEDTAGWQAEVVDSVGWWVEGVHRAGWWAFPNNTFYV